MNKTIFLIIFIFIPSFLFAQEKYATTSAGETVILKSDGTWIYANKKNTANPQIQGIKSNPSSNSPTNKPIYSTKKYPSTKSKPSNSRTYHRGPRGGCYYINSNGNKTYVDRSLCN